MKNNKKKNAENMQKTPQQIAKEIAESRFPSDVMGSYTGITEDGEKPVQDADDL